MIIYQICANMSCNRSVFSFIFNFQFSMKDHWQLLLISRKYSRIHCEYENLCKWNIIVIKLFKKYCVVSLIIYESVKYDLFKDNLTMHLFQSTIYSSLFWMTSCLFHSSKIYLVSNSNSFLNPTIYQTDHFLCIQIICKQLPAHCPSG